MFTLDGLEDTRAIISYVKDCMKQKRLGATEIQEYEKQAKRYDFNYLLQISQEYLDMLNSMESQQDVKVYYTNNL